jgi:outer membrane protein
MRLWFVFILLALSFAVGQEQRIAHVDSKVIFDGYQGTSRAQVEYDKQVAIWEQKVNLMQKEAEQLRERLNRQSLLLGEDRRREVEAELAQKETELKEFIERIYGRQGQLVKENEKISAPIIEKIKSAIREIALQEGYDLVIDKASGALVYSTSSHDITRRVIDYLNRP